MVEHRRRAGGAARLSWRLSLVLVVVSLAACTRAGPAATHSADPALRVGIRQPSTLDPALRANPSDRLIAQQIFEPLVRFDPATQALVPALAASWDVRDGASRFMFHLRPGARFQNGVTVTAADVAFSLTRLAAKQTGSSLAYLLQSVAGFDALHVSGTATDLSGLQVIDPLTLQITLSAPWAAFPVVLSDPATAPIPAMAYQADPAGFVRHPVGAGPYELAPGAGLPGNLTLQRAATYWGTKPAIATVRFVVNPQPANVPADLSAGRLDVGEIPPPLIPTATATWGPGGFGPLAGGIYLGFNLSDPALQSIPLRQAISLALDRPAIAADYGGVLVPAASLVPPGVLGHDDAACGGLCTRDQARARSLLAQLPAGVTPTVAFDYPAGAPDDAVATTIAADLAAVGIQVQPRPHAAGEYLSMLNADSQSMFLMAWVADYPLAERFLTPLFTAGAADNHTGYADPGVQGVLASARAAIDPAQSLGFYDQAERAVLAGMVLSPLGFFRNHYAAAKRVQGFAVDSLGGLSIASLRLRGA